MVDTCQEEKLLPYPVFSSFLGLRFHPPVHCQRRGHHVTTVDQSDMRGLVTAGFGFVVELPLSKDGSFSRNAYSHSAFEGSPVHDRVPANELEGM